MTTALMDHPATKRECSASPLRIAMVFSIGALLGAVGHAPVAAAQEMGGGTAMSGASDPAGAETGAEAASAFGEAGGDDPALSEAQNIARSAGRALAEGADTPATKSPVVVELFTSQGCAACPPADKLLEGLSERDDVIALALHVDYWDYLGWKDPFGQPAFTSRQKGYARAVKERMIYTPQMIINGQQRLLGADRMAVKSALNSATAQTSPVNIGVSQEGDSYRISLSANPPLGHDAMVQVVRYIPSASVDILRGENAGLSVNYTNIVTQWHIVADWDGQTPMSFDTQIDGASPAVVIVQGSQPGRSVPLPGAIMGAARIK